MTWNWNPLLFVSGFLTVFLNVEVTSLQLNIRKSLLVKWCDGKTSVWYVVIVCKGGNRPWIKLRGQRETTYWWSRLVSSGILPKEANVLEISPAARGSQKPVSAMSSFAHASWFWSCLKTPLLRYRWLCGSWYGSCNTSIGVFRVLPFKSISFWCALDACLWGYILHLSFWDIPEMWPEVPSRKFDQKFTEESSRRRWIWNWDR